MRGKNVLTEKRNCERELSWQQQSVNYLLVSRKAFLLSNITLHLLAPFKQFAAC